MNVFINLPVADLPASIAFYGALGYSVDPRMTDDTAACIVIGDTLCAMLLTHARYSDFTAKRIADTHATSATLLAYQLPDRAAVDAVMAAALAAGGTEPRPAQDLPFMYGRAFSDPDGHTWEPFWFDTASLGTPP